MNEYEIRELCEAFFDAYQDGRVDVLDRLYAADCIVWHNVFGRETTRDENLARYPDSFRGQRRRTYNDRIVNTFHDGFVIQYTLNGVMHTGHKGALWICIVAQCRDGKITRIDEYMDSSKFAAWMGDPTVRKDWQTIELCDRFFDAIEQKDYDDARVLLRTRSGGLAQPRLPVPTPRRQPRDVEAGYGDPAEDALQGAPGARVRRRLRAAAHDLRDA